MFENLGINYNDIKSLTPKETKIVTEKEVIILDIREHEETKYKNIDVPRIIHLPFSEFKEKYKDIPSDAPIIVMDSSGMKSRDIAAILKKEGFGEIAYMAGGLREWELDGLPLIINKDEELYGSCFCQLTPKRKTKNINKK